MKHLRYWHTQENRCMSWPDPICFYTVMATVSTIVNTVESIAW
jgi:hypothetical protein